MLADADRLERIGVRAWVDIQQPDVYPASIRTDAARLQRWRSLQLANDAHSWAATTRMIARADFTGIPERVHCPTLVVASAFYPPRPPERVKQFADRIAGSEFAIIQTGITHLSQTTAMVERIVERVGAPYDVDGHHIVIGVSIGIAVASYAKVAARALS